MIEAKDVARKIAAGCNHSAPIFIPCASCTEFQIKAWEASVREDTRANFREQWLALEAENARLKEREKGLLARIDKVQSYATKLEAANKELQGSVKSGKREIADLKLCLDVKQSTMGVVKE